MKHIFTEYKVQLVKEKANKYECNNVIGSWKDVEKISYEVLEIDKECEEVLIALAINTTNKVIGIFEVSRGSLNASIVTVRELFKRLIVCNSNKFILIHNHPSGIAKPSDNDLSTCKKIKKASGILDVELLDFCIVGKKFLSFKNESLM